MDIEYLLALQSLRQSLPMGVEQALAAISFVCDPRYLAAFVIIAYWCINKRAGLFLAVCLIMGNFLTQVTKCFACVYRPWIRDARIVPSPLATGGATGYSFPSGHTTGAGAGFGGLAVVLYHAKHKVLSVLCILFVLLAGFSRNFLGVHTPQDVLVALLISAIAVGSAVGFMRWIDKADANEPGHNKDLIATIAIVGVCAILTFVLFLKPYPMDYVDGKLLVDPQKMMKDACQSVGLVVGFMPGWLLERRRVGFSTDGLTMGTRVVRFVCGIVITIGMFLLIEGLCKLVMPYNLAQLFGMATISFSAVFLGPLAFTAIEHRQH